ncbi:MAG: hypothetical protein H0W56_06820 [Acidothermales bacterium]|jgi:hypothetical protein|nr:hypothetical protein [Acidothermales bacterium]
MTTDSATLTVPQRFSGPPRSANGGYLAGRLARHLDGDAAVVTLRQPPPLEAPMRVESTGTGARLLFGGALVAEADPTTLPEDDLVEPVSFAQAEAAAAAYAGRFAHPFPSCFVCGVDRDAGDGMLLAPGPVPERPGTVAAAWVPDASLGMAGEVAPEFVWAALDCPGGWAVDLVGRPMVLGRMTAALDAVPYVGERCVVMGQARRAEGRKTFTATTLYDGDGRVLARAVAVWITVDPAMLGAR